MRAKPYMLAALALSKGGSRMTSSLSPLYSTLEGPSPPKNCGGQHEGQLGTIAVAKALLCDLLAPPALEPRKVIHVRCLAHPEQQPLPGGTKRLPNCNAVGCVEDVPPLVR